MKKIATETIEAPGAPPTAGTCGVRPTLDQGVYNAMAPPCTKKPHHHGPHSWETDKWRIR